MSIKFDITAQSDFVLVTAEGEYSFAEAKQIIQLAFAAVAEHKLPKLLFDCRNVVSALTTPQRFEVNVWLSEFYFQEPKVTYIPIALVGNEPFVDPGRFGETVAVNRGVPIKVTMDMQEALDWLDIQSGPADS